MTQKEHFRSKEKLKWENYTHDVSFRQWMGEWY